MIDKKKEMHLQKHFTKFLIETIKQLIVFFLNQQQCIIKMNEKVIIIIHRQDSFFTIQGA